MKVNSKNLIKLFLSLVIILSFFNMPALSYIAQNGSGQGYGNGDNSSDDERTMQLNSIELYVVRGAGYFLKANAGIQEILNRVEWQDLSSVNYEELSQMVQDTLLNISNARIIYGQLVQVAEVTPYNPEVIDWLKNFDYDNFMMGNGLNKVVFNQVRAYLEKGDITGNYRHFLANIKEIEQMVVNIQFEISLNRMPGLSLLWKLNEKCAEVSLFGSYAARIFHAR